MIKKLIFTLTVALGVTISAKAADGDLFPYPQPPADMDRLDERCDFIVSRFWRPCDFKSAMSKTEKLRSTFGDWISFMPYATADTVFASIDRLLASNAKNGPLTLMFAQMAEEFAYNDTAEMRSAEVFLPFAKAAAAHKKIPAPERAKFALMVQKIENSMEGKPVAHFEYITPEGLKTNLSSTRTQMIAVVFNRHDCRDCSTGRVRLSADYNINTLIDRGLLTVISIEPGEATNEWLEATASYPSNWIVGAMPDANDWFELPASDSMSVMLLDGRHKVLAKNIPIENFMATMLAMRRQAGL